MKTRSHCRFGTTVLIIVSWPFLLALFDGTPDTWALRRILVTYDPRKTEEREALASAKGEATRLELIVIENSIAAPLEIEPALANLKEGGRDGILIVQSGTNLNIPGRILQVATSKKIPTMYPASFLQLTWVRF